MRADAYWQRVEQSDGCWLWHGAIGTTGYGNVWWEGRTEGAHRVAWLLTYGPIPPEQCVLHRCDVRQCVRPDHLYLGSKATNSADMVAKGRSGAGVANSQARLDPATVEAIREAARWELQRVVAERFGVSPAMVSAIVNGRRWRQLQATE